MKTLNYKKYFVFVYILLVVVIFSGCELPSGKRDKKDGYSIIEIDNCEYIEVSYLVGTTHGYYSITHKGNCKYCVNKK